MYSTGDETSSRPGWREKLCREGNVEEVNSTGGTLWSMLGKGSSLCLLGNLLEIWEYIRTAGEYISVGNELMKVAL